MKAVEFRGMEPAGLKAEVEKRRRELLDIRCQAALGEDIRPHRVRELKKDVARLMTVLREKQGAAK